MIYVRLGIFLVALIVDKYPMATLKITALTKSFETIRK